MHTSGSRTLAALFLVAAPALGAQSASMASEGAVMPAPAGATHTQQLPVSIPGAVGESWSRSLARADSVGPRKRAFHIGAATGAVLASGFVLAVMQPWDEGGCDGGPDGRAVAGAMLVSAVPGALLGGVAGVIVHDIGRAATR